jgi:glycosyltransferase involved in cell wall biosynthesis
MGSTYRDTFKNTHFLFVVNTYKIFGGAERQALILASYMKEHISEHVTFLAFEDGEMFKAMIQNEQIETTFFPFNHKASKLKKSLQYFSLVQFLKKIKPGVLIPYVSESNKIVAQIWHYTGAKFAFWNQRDEGRKLYGSEREKKIIRKVSAIVSNSYEGKEALMATYNLDSNQITVINNGIIPYNETNSFDDLHRTLGIESNRPIISMIANITTRKDHSTLLRAWKIVIDNFKKTKKVLPFLLLVGRKYDTYDQLRLLAFDLNLSDHVHFYGEVNPVQAIIEKSYFCVFSSNLEGCPNGVLECMEQGKAVIGTRISGIVQALGAQYADRIYSEPNNPESMARKIIHLLERPDLVLELNAYNKKRILNEFSVKKMVESHLKIINL